MIHGDNSVYKAVEVMVDLAREGMSRAEVADHLNIQGFTTPKGDKWNPTTVGYMNVLFGGATFRRGRRVVK